MLLVIVLIFWYNVELYGSFTWFYVKVYPICTIEHYIQSNPIQSGLEGVTPAKRDFWEVSVSRIKEGTSSEKIKFYLQSKNIEVKEVFVFASKIKGTVLAKVKVAIKHKERVLSAETWPKDIRVASWIYKSKNAKKNDAAEQRLAPTPTL